MIPTIIVVAAVCFAFWVTVGDLYVPGKKRKPNHAPEAGLSNGGHAVLNDFMSLPEENRPYSTNELIDVLKALDVKWGWDKVQVHFRYHAFHRQEFQHNCGCTTNKLATDGCPFKDHAALFTAIDEISKALAQREHDLAIAGVSRDLDRVTELTNKLHAEAGIVKEVTQELL